MANSKRPDAPKQAVEPVRYVIDEPIETDVLDQWVGQWLAQSVQQGVERVLRCGIRGFMLRRNRCPNDGAQCKVHRAEKSNDGSLDHPLGEKHCVHRRLRLFTHVGMQP